MGERFGTHIKEVVPPQMFLITDASKTESPVDICCLIMWEVPPGYILRKKKNRSVIVSDSWELNLKSEDKSLDARWDRHSTTPCRHCCTGLWQLPVVLLGFFLV